MEMEAGKLFVGGISWDTSEDRLREYFQAFGEVVEAVIMRDRTTGRARGFGFVVFANPFVAEKVVRERHIIDGRTVEAKKAVPRDDHQTFVKTSGSLHAPPSPGPTHTKKIFVGGLASTVTETDFKNYFGQFGPITDVVVMYDHNTQRPRGFGFITFDSEDSVDRVLVKTFHELNGKMVEVKRAVPKELSPGPARSPSSVYSFGPNRASVFLNNPYSPGNNNNNIHSVGRFSPVSVGRGGYPPYSPGNHSVGSNLDSGLSLNGMDYSYFGGNSSKNGSFLSATNRNGWENVKTPNYITNSNDFLSFETGNGGLFGGGLGNIGEIWGGSPVSGKGRENIVCGGVQDNYGGMAGYTRGDRDNAESRSLSSFMNNVCDEGFGNLYGGGDSFYSDHAWNSFSRELKGSGPFSYGGGDRAADVASNTSVGYVGEYSVARSNRGIAA
ncbi:heterogeneous nuclear ribonucleoprotein 1 [Phtheirospermum japonicum]|uniref:Heterogeneous nuclear ribonucleoprotein 1 n=1 Tax=Phtheirospermum japonicum TaxID=374723 RepID=A0A830CUD7_9LAMI|nr:heterogeneous nuclear ribonucleoprotein 1 [Phtheirospermum japonicum]